MEVAFRVFRTRFVPDGSCRRRVLLCQLFLCPSPAGVQWVELTYDGPGARPELLSPKHALTALSRKRCGGRTLLAG
jgi:hypothetical protein